MAVNAVSVQPVGFAEKGCELVECEVPPASVAVFRAVGMAPLARTRDLFGSTGGSSQTVVSLFHARKHNAFVVGEMGPLVHGPPSGEALLAQY